MPSERRRSFTDGRRAANRSPPTLAHGARLEARIDRETHGRLLTVHFYSRALHREADYLIYLPAGDRADRPLPAFYLLHGMAGKPVAFTVNANIEVRLERLVRVGRVEPMLLVFPDGRIDGRTASDSERANTPSGDYESYVTNVVRDVDDRYASLPCLCAHDATNSEALPLADLHLRGRDDPDSVQIPGMAAALERAGARESWAIYPGGHSWNTWTPRVDQTLIMASRDLSHPLGGASSTCV